jgi:hypothetical protein
MGLMKVFSGSEIMAQALQSRIEEAGVMTVVKNNIQAARTSGFGEMGQAMEVFIYERDFDKAHKVIESFKMGE